MRKQGGLIYKRTATFFSLLMFCMLLTILNLFSVSNGEALARTAQQQSTYRLSVSKTRGTIYDCKLRPLTNAETEYRAAVAPTVESAAALSHILSQEELTAVYPSLTDGRPFALSVPEIAANTADVVGLDLFQVKKRYGESHLAAHVIGYLDGSGQGVAGVEKVFNQELSENQGGVTATYKVDALHRALAGEEIQVEDTTGLQNSGVALTLDEDIQRLAEQAAKDHLERGAVVVTEVPGCQIRAMASLPDFDPGRVADYLNDGDAPLLNRAMSAYSLGSVFKLVSAAAALQYGISPDTEFECTGAVDVDGQPFHCYNGESHGAVNMEGAIAKSCNTYFIRLMEQVPQAQFLLTARSLGFGLPTEIAPGYSAAAGNLPNLSELKIPRALANFSFGQGSLTATPLQVCGLVNAVADGGWYTPPSLYLGRVDGSAALTETAEEPEPVQVMSAATAELLQKFMIQSVQSGTSRRFAPDRGGAGAKTATAQTGRITDGVEAVESWVAGFYPAENPRYVITILGEGGTGGGATCGPVFKQIADGLEELMGDAREAQKG